MGCFDTIAVVISDITGPTIDSINVTDLDCYGDNDGTAQVFISGGSAPYTNVWKDLAGNTIDSGAVTFVSQLPGGVYTVCVTDLNLCVECGIFVINEPQMIFSQITLSTDASCNGLCDGTALVSISGGTLPYTYMWATTPVQTTAMADSLCAGLNNVFVTDSNSCFDTNSIFINEPAPIAISLGPTDVSCNNLCDGDICINTVTGGTPPYTYSWNTSPVQTTSCIVGLCPATYDLQVTDINGCIEIASYTITEPAPLVPVPSSNPAKCGDANGLGIASAIGGTTPYTFEWFDDLGNPIGQINDTAFN